MQYYGMNDELLSAIYDWPYKLNEIQPKVRLIKKMSCVTINDEIDKGYHSYHNLDLAICNLRLSLIDLNYKRLCKCIISKGSRYYKNSEEYVSNQIKIVEILKY
jgi:hypothetical protein